MFAFTRARSSISRALCVLLACLLLVGCGINTIPTLHERAKAGWSEV
jgi:LemA protein